MEVELRGYQNFARFVRKLLVICGIWPNSQPLLKKLSYFSILFSTFVVMLTVANFCFHNVTDVMLLTRGMGLAVSFFATFLKVFIFLAHQDDLSFLNDVLSARYVQDLKSKDDLPYVLGSWAAIAKFIFVHFLFLSATMLMYGLGPLVSLRKHGNYGHVFPAIYPFYYEPGSLVYWFFYLVELEAALALSFVNTGIDSLFVIYSLEMVGELRLLGKRFANLRLADAYRDKLRECIARHYMLIDSKKRLESTYGITSIWTAVSSALVLCSLMFQVTEIAKSQTSYVYIIQLCCYLFPKLLQVLSYAWHGNLITDESGSCLYSMYDSEWHHTCNPQMKNDILIVLTQEPLALLAKGCMYIQLDMFTAILKASLSYFAILRTLNEKK